VINALARLDDFDRRLFDGAARHESAALDSVVPRLTHSADHGLLWCGVAAVLAVSGQRRVAVRGLASLAVASSIANVVFDSATHL